MAAKIGPGSELDALLLAYAIPLFLVSALQNTLGSCWTPGLVGVKNNQTEFHKILGCAQTLTICSSLFLTCIFLAIMPAFFPLITGKLPKELSREAIRLGSIFSVVIPIQGLSFLWIASLQAKNNYILPALVPICTPTLGVAVLTFTAQPTIGILAWSLVGGAVLEAAVMFCFMVVRRDLCLPTFNFKHSAAISIVHARRFGLLGLASIIIGTIPLSDQIMAGWAGPAGVAHFSFASRVTGFITAVAALAISQSVLPALSELCDAPLEFARRLRQIFGLVFVSGIAIGLAILVSNNLIIQWLFGRGAFTSEDVVIVSSAQFVYAFEIPFFLCWLIACRATAAQGHTIFSIASSSVIALSNIILNAAFVGKYGVAGICAATSLSFLIGFIISLPVIFWKK